MIIINSNNQVTHSAEKLEKITENGQNFLEVTFDGPEHKYRLPWSDNFTIIDGINVPDFSKHYLYKDGQLTEINLNDLI